ncbi:glycosyl hydrolase family 95 catalytic domain-containing protein [Amycolatopsis samaneae]|uniref:Glycoside hydrolase family 95-like protein n=1 Tax=Amycolatopsis samaneae TaxID=664691 RepID=A0ABW5GGW8_9PSEU
MTQPASFPRRDLLGGTMAGILATTFAAAAPASAAETPPDALVEAASPRVRGMSDEQWARFLSGQDLRWQRVPRTWYEGAFLGNGFVGTQVYRERTPSNRDALKFTVDHSESQDHRPAFGNEWGVARLPIGKALLTPVGEFTGADLRLDLWNAELSGTVSTDRGTLEIHAFVHSTLPLLVIDVRPSAGERGFSLTFEPLPAVSPRIVREQPPKGFDPNPAWVTHTEGDVSFVTQPLFAGGQNATAYRSRRATHGGRTLVLSTAHSFPGTEAERSVRRAVGAAGTVDALRVTHRRWWHEFYRRGFLSIPDAKLQSFYWIQLYKLASAARAEAPIMATTGPWLEPTPWPSAWFNLNAQLEYWPVHGSNHLELDPIPRTVRENQQTLVDGLRPEYRADSMGLRRSTDARFADAGYVGVPNPDSDAEIGDLPWLLHNVWLSYRHTMDVAILRDDLFPVLRKAMNYYLHFLAYGADGRLHLPPTFSPEYGRAPDCNYDLALIRWSCRTLLDAAKTLGVDDPLAPKWREVLAKLVDYPVDEHGLMIGTGVPFAKSHRHYSHILAAYPLYLLNVDDPAQAALVAKSLDHWISFEGALRGFSFTGASSLSAALGRGDDARKHLREFVARFAQANTMYYEAGPVIETPLSAAQSVHDMLCQSWGEEIRLFPALPAQWRDVTLHDFRTQGAFLVSAVRRAGATTFVRVRSLAGEPLKLKTSIDGPVTVEGTRRWRHGPNGTLEIDLARGGEVLVYPRGRRPDTTIAPVPIGEPAPPWGLPMLPPSGQQVTVELAGVLNSDGVTSEFYLGDGDFDGAGNTYPAAALPQTGQLTDDGVPFLFVNGAEGTPNNVLGTGQAIPLPAGKYATLHVLGAADTGKATTTLTVSYRDGTSAQVPLRLTDWRSAASFGETEAVVTTQMHTRAGIQATRLAIFHQRVPLDAAREVVSVTLPAATGPRPHLFALTLEKPKGP